MAQIADEKITFEKQESEDKHGRYVATVDGLEGEAELAYTHRHEGLISADHVETPVEWRGRGIALALVEHVIAEARENHFKIIPKCPFVMRQYERHPEWADVFTAKLHPRDDA